MFKELNEHETAIRSFNLGLKLDSTKMFRAELLYQRGLTYYSQSKYELAIADFNMALQAKPDNELRRQILYGRSSAYASQNKARKAINDYNALLKEENLPNAYRRDILPSCARTYFALADYEKSYEIYSKLLKSDPAGSQLQAGDHAELGYIYCLQKKYDKALEQLTKSILLMKKGHKSVPHTQGVVKAQNLRNLLIQREKLRVKNESTDGVENKIRINAEARGLCNGDSLVKNTLVSLGDEKVKNDYLDKYVNWTGYEDSLEETVTLKCSKKDKNKKRKNMEMPRGRFGWMMYDNFISNQLASYKKINDPNNRALFCKEIFKGRKQSEVLNHLEYIKDETIYSTQNRIDICFYETEKTIDLLKSGLLIDKNLCHIYSGGHANYISSKKDEQNNMQLRFEDSNHRQVAYGAAGDTEKLIGFVKKSHSNKKISFSIVSMTPVGEKPSTPEQCAIALLNKHSLGPVFDLQLGEEKDLRTGVAYIYKDNNDFYMKLLPACCGYSRPVVCKIDGLNHVLTGIIGESEEGKLLSKHLKRDEFKQVYRLIAKTYKDNYEAELPPPEYIEECSLLSSHLHISEKQIKSYFEKDLDRIESNNSWIAKILTSKEPKMLKTKIKFFSKLFQEDYGKEWFKRYTENKLSADFLNLLDKTVQMLHSFQACIAIHIQKINKAAKSSFRFFDNNKIKINNVEIAKSMQDKVQEYLVKAIEEIKTTNHEAQLGKFNKLREDLNNDIKLLQGSSKAKYPRLIEDYVKDIPKESSLHSQVVLN